MVQLFRRVSAKGQLCIFMVCYSLTLSVAGYSSEPQLKTVTVSGDFRDINDSVKQAIEGRGIHIAHTLPVSDMLNRTGDDYGIEEDVFIHAETVEFCDARLSHELVQENPENILLCPFTISIYVLKNDPDHVHLSYRRPFALPDDDSRSLIQKMVQLMDGVISEAIAW